LIRPTLKTYEMVLRAPGMLALHIALDTVETATPATLWGKPVEAYDMGDLSARWFSDFLGTEVRLVRFDPEQRRLSDPTWTGDLEAENAFQDGFPLLVTSTASHAELNRRLEAAGVPAVSTARFRPNLVLDGLDAHGEDALDEIVLPTADGPIRLRIVKPCARCPIPDVDPATGERGHAVGDALRSYRVDPRHDGKVTFGMNAVIVEGIDRVLRVGMSGSANYRFD
ncbi:MAG: MOSC domain-containing protein, partial [Caldimonas sp.]